MNGYGSHTFQWVNAERERFWVKFHFKTDQGIETLTSEESARVAGENPQAHQVDLVEAIERGDYPSWTLKVQVMPEADASSYRYNPFDLTKVWPHGGLSAGRDRQTRARSRTPTTTSRKWSRRPSIPATSSRESVPRPTRCSRAGSSPTATRTATGWERTTPSFR